MDVVILTDSWGEGRGGRERYLAALAASLGREGDRVEVLCVGEGRDLVAAAAALHANRPGQVLLAAFPAPGATHWQLHAGLVSTSFAAEREAMEPGPRKALFPLGNLLNRRRARLLRTEKELLNSRIRPRLMVWSEALARELATAYGVSRSEVTVLPPGVDIVGSEPAAPAVRWARPNELCLLFGAHNYALKGLSPLLAALGAAARRGLRFRLAVAGRGDRGPWRFRAWRLGISESVIFLGAVAGTRMRGLLSAADVLVHPTFFDPFSLVCLEALAAGTPVVTTRRNGIAERMEDGREGLLLDDPRDGAALAEALERLSDPAVRGRMAKAALDRAREQPFADHARAVRAWLGGA